MSSDRLNKAERKTAVQDMAREADDLLGRLVYDDIDNASQVDSLRGIIASCTAVIDAILIEDEEEKQEAQDIQRADTKTS